VLPGLFVAALFAVVIWRQPERPLEPVEWVLSGATMGTTYSVKGVGAATPPGGLGERIEAVLDEVNRAMSTYIEDSEISAFNRHDVVPFPASPALLEVVAEAQRIAELSGGAFDITVGPLVDAWGFGPADVDEMPSEELIDRLLNQVGHNKLKIDLERGLLIKSRPQLKLDLSAIAKGYAVDRVAEVVGGAGVDAFLAEIGGEIAARGRNGRGQVWRIGIERPEDDGRAVHTVVPLADKALATSGDYRNFRFREGVRLSHTIDPRLGRPIIHQLASVSVVHPSCMSADALATALEVLGPDEGIEFADRYDIAAFFLVREGVGRFRELRSRAWLESFENFPPPDDVLH
jgi:thiamine biosynthesis lipoprotein